MSNEIIENNTKIYKRTDMPSIEKGKVALLCVDLQYWDAAAGHGCFSKVDPENPGEYSYYFDRLRDVVLPNVRKLQDAFRKSGNEVIHVRIESLTQDGRERSPQHKRLNSHVAPGSKESEFLPEVAPVGDEIKLSKTTSGVFNGTCLEYVLHNLGITQLVIVGVVTNECVENAVRDAGDKSFTVFVPEDCTAAVTPEEHVAAIKAMDFVYAHITSAEEIIDVL